MFRPLDPNQEVRIIVAEPHSFKNFAEARIWAKQNIVGSYFNPEIGEVKVSSKAIDKYLSGKVVGKSVSLDTHLSALPVLPQLIESSIVGEIHEDRDNNSNLRDIVRLYGAINHNGMIKRVKITVKRYTDEDQKPKAYSYEVTEIEPLDGTLETTHTQNADFVPTSNNSILVANLLQGVETANNLQENLLADTFTSVAQSAADRLGIEIEIDEGMPAKGSYNPRTGRVRVNPTRHATAEDVQRTILHEAIGHGGIQAVMGDQFSKMCGMALHYSIIVRAI